MRRQNIYRGRDFLGDWHYGVVSADGEHIVKLHIGTDGNVRELHQKVDSRTICNNTGFKDINGSDIYEGDIVEYIVDEKGNPIESVANFMEVRFFNGCFDIVQGDQWISLLWHQARRLVVRGNVYDNPELKN